MFFSVMGKRLKLDYELRARDIVPVKGIVDYVRRKIEDLGSMDISLRSATLVLYNFYLGVGLTLASINGLEKLMQ